MDRVIHPDLKQKLSKKFFLLSILLAVLWLLFYFLDNSLTYIKPGARVVYSAKLSALKDSKIFPDGNHLKIAMFGDSKTLSGFRAQEFDDFLDIGSYSYNFGLPDSQQFVKELIALIRKGDIPDIVLLQHPWKEEEQKSFYKVLKHDKEIVDLLLPFRYFPRNLAIFAFNSFKYGGPANYYNYARDIARTVLDNRGYYFIEGQSHYPNDRLPDNYFLPSDKPDVVKRRNLEFQSEMFRKLEQITRDYGILFVFVPEYFRHGSYAEVSGDNKLISQQLLAFSNFKNVGPDYILLDNRYFSDPVHLNPVGATYYTRYLAGLLKTELTLFSEKKMLVSR